MIATKMLWLFKLNSHTTVTLPHSALNCIQMFCVMTCSAERGIHQETIELGLEKYTITENITEGACNWGVQSHPILYNGNLTLSSRRREWVNEWSSTARIWSFKLKSAPFCEHLTQQRTQQNGSLSQLALNFGSLSAFQWCFTGKGHERQRAADRVCMINQQIEKWRV